MRVHAFAGAAHPRLGWMKGREVPPRGGMGVSVQQVGEAQLLERMAQLVVGHRVDLHRAVAGLVVPARHFA